MRTLIVSALMALHIAAAQGYPLSLMVQETSTTGSRQAARFGNGAPLPDLTFSFVTFEKATYAVTPSARSILVVDAQRDASGCQQPSNVPMRLIVKNVGLGDFVPRDSNFQVVGVNFGTYGGAWKIDKLTPGQSQTFNFNEPLPPGKYTLQAMIDLHKGVAEANGNNDILNWPVEIRCDTRLLAPRPIFRGPVSKPVTP